MRILLLDNYDSFSYNLVHIIKELKYSCDVFRNDKITIEEASTYDKILLSPGPGIPDEAGIMKAIIRELGSVKSILGVCLGFQGIAEVYNARLYNMATVLHGMTSSLVVREKEELLFKGVAEGSEIGHYHSWAILPESVNGELQVTATDETGMIMAIRHRTFDVRGVQFHPESILTPEGKKMISNWLQEK